MFGSMRDKMVASIGMRSVSLEDLSRFETDSVDSLPASIASSSRSSVRGRQSLLGRLGLKKSDSNEDADSYTKDPKEHAIRVLKTIKRLNRLNSKEINLMSFMEMLQTQFYNNISLNLLKEFMDCHKSMPKPIYFHYYIYFLNYAEFYHFTRGMVDVIDESKKEFHVNCLEHIRTQLKFVYRIINKKKEREVNI